MIVILLLLLIPTLLYYYFNNCYKYWERKGVNGPKPSFLFGNMHNSCLFRESPGKTYEDIHKIYSTEAIVGMYRSISPVLLVRKPELIKTMLVKSFANFHDNDFYIDKKTDPIMGRNPFFSKGEEWKTVRGQITPAFTSGKMKWLYPLLEVEARRMVQFLQDEKDTYEAKELSVSFTLNNIATCAFGLEGKCFDEENSEFRQLYNEFMSPNATSMLVLLMSVLFPKISKIIPVRFVSKNVENKIVNIVRDTLKYREDNNLQRTDLMELLNQLKQSSNGEFTDIDIAAQLLTFFSDGSETSSIVMSFALFALAENQESQEKLRNEISEAFRNYQGELPYDILQTLPYLDAVINESLRRYTPTPFIQKLCTADFIYQPENSQKSINIEEGTSVVVSLSGIHLDPKFYKEPLCFRPERFLQDDQITKDAFLPFGEGPRTCIGKRFALLQIKTGIAHLVKNFKMSINDRTQLPLQFKATSPFLEPIGGLWLNFNKI